MPICNYCSLKRIRIRAAEKNLRVNSLPSMRGTDVYVYPFDINLEKLDQKERGRYFEAHYLEIPDHCICLDQRGNKDGICDIIVKGKKNIFSNRERKLSYFF